MELPELSLAGLPAAQSHPVPGGSPFPPIADYAFLSDCEASALVASSGNVEWMCLPRMDGPSVFGAVLDRGAGSFRLGPADVRVPSARRYLPGTMVMETTWAVPTGWAVVQDLLVVGPWGQEPPKGAGDGGYRRAPTDYRAAQVLLRTIRCLEGTVDVELECEPAFDYGRIRGSWHYPDADYGVAECRAEGQTTIRLTTDFNLGFEGPLAIARHRLHAGQQRFCALSWGDAVPPKTYTDAYAQLSVTARYWHEWIDRGQFPDHPWRDYLVRSALTLKGLTYAPTGALLAAATASLPETPGGERNYDYRYTWLRDATYMLWALHTLGLTRDADDFYYFIADVAAEPEADLQIMYGIGGERELTERTLDHLSGYEGARPVRIGNGAWDQRQHDVWGVLLDSVYLHTRIHDRLDERRWPMLVRQVEAALKHWRDPDQGLWEVRGTAQHFTASKVMCWVAADRGARLAQLRGDTGRAQEWRRAAQEIHEEVCANATDDRGVFCQHYDTNALDASVLLIPLLGFLPPGDPRVRATVLAIADELTEDELVLRYRVEETDDGFNGEEGTFTICSFWLVSALVEIGEVDRARALCEKLLSHASPLALYAEEIDPHTGRHLGNFPQAFSHLALINAVMRLIREDERLGDAVFRAPHH
jgi:GH15 family glucan-1,4-alpha-glucosidase